MGYNSVVADNMGLSSFF